MTPSPPRGRRRRGGSALRTGTGGLIILSLAACAPPSNFELVPTGRVGRALAGIEGVEATAFLVPVGRAPPSDGLALTRGDDGVSFSGFVEAAPGAYALEVVFRGQPTGAPGPVFLGRWTSDVFTVEAGAVVEARFSQPIDPIGRPEDEGDLDRDGLGLLDEYLWSADPNASDADEDGLRDGVDCDPGVATETFQILAGGSIEDCDADGVRRPDLPFPGSGLDCDDRAPEVRPGAVDDCSDALDQDCNPATCPSDDRDPPVLEGTLPAAGAAVGCHVELEATVADDDAASLELVASDLVPSGPDRLAGTRLGAGLWRFPDFNTLAGANSGLREGRREVVLNAVDAAGNRSAFALSFSFDFSRPALRSFEPAAGGNRSAPYEVAIQAPGAARIGLFAAPRAQDGTYFADERASALGEVAAETARFTVDPADLSEAPWMLYAVVTDAAGNELRPQSPAFPSAENGELSAIADHRCGSETVRVPVRVVTISQTPRLPQTWRPLLETAREAALDVDPSFSWVSVIGFGVDATGGIDLTDARSFTKRWTFGFRTPQGRTLSVTWRTPAWGGENPLVTPDDGSIVPEIPFPAPGSLPDSPTVLRLYAEGSCRPLAGRDGDFVLYSVVDALPRVNLANEEGDGWRARVNEQGDLSVDFDCP